MPLLRQVVQAYLHQFFSSEVIGGKGPTPTAQLAPNIHLPTTVNYQVGQRGLRQLRREVKLVKCIAAGD